MVVRALFQAAQVPGVNPPYSTLHLKIFYPAQESDSEQARSIGIIPADSRQAPFPVVVFFSGFNCGQEVYQWLAVKLAARGMVVVTYDWVTQSSPGAIGLTPGIDITGWAPGVYGTVPTATALPTVLTALAQLQSTGILAGLLDLQRIVLGGHSAGGRAAIENANPDFFPSVVAAFAYAAHTATGVQMGYAPGTIAPLPDVLPLMLIGGTCDGVIAHSSALYGVTWQQATTPVLRTFQEAIAGGRDDSYLLLLEGANHYAVTYPFDETTGRAFLDFPATQPEVAIRDLIAEAIGLFIQAHVQNQNQAASALLQLFTSHPSLIAAFERK
jgi:dienelactone hydrolase